MGGSTTPSEPSGLSTLKKTPNNLSPYFPADYDHWQILQQSMVQPGSYMTDSTPPSKILPLNQCTIGLAMKMKEKKMFKQTFICCPCFNENR